MNRKCILMVIFAFLVCSYSGSLNAAEIISCKSLSQGDLKRMAKAGRSFSPVIIEDDTCKPQMDLCVMKAKCKVAGFLDEKTGEPTGEIRDVVQMIACPALGPRRCPYAEACGTHKAIIRPKIHNPKSSEGLGVFRAKHSKAPGVRDYARQRNIEIKWGKGVYRIKFRPGSACKQDGHEYDVCFGGANAKDKNNPDAKLGIQLVACIQPKPTKRGEKFDCESARDCDQIVTQVITDGVIVGPYKRMSETIRSGKGASSRPGK